jgi:hypothetical protein
MPLPLLKIYIWHQADSSEYKVECVWNVMAHTQKPDFVFRRNGRVYLNRRGRQFTRLLAAEVCPSAVVMLDTPCSEVVRRVLATHSIRQFPLHFPSRASPCAITFQLDYTVCVLKRKMPIIRSNAYQGPRFWCRVQLNFSLCGFRSTFTSVTISYDNSL